MNSDIHRLNNCKNPTTCDEIDRGVVGFLFFFFKKKHLLLGKIVSFGKLVLVSVIQFLKLYVRPRKEDLVSKFLFFLSRLGKQCHGIN